MSSSHPAPVIALRCATTHRQQLLDWAVQHRSALRHATLECGPELAGDLQQLGFAVRLWGSSTGAAPVPPVFAFSLEHPLASAGPEAEQFFREAHRHGVPVAATAATADVLLAATLPAARNRAA